MLLLSLLIDWHPETTPSARCAAAISFYGRRVQAIVEKRRPRAFDTIVLPLEEATADLHDALAPTIFLDESVSCENDLRWNDMRTNASPQLYAAVAAASRSNTAMNDVDRKLAQHWLTRLRLGGGALPAAKHDELLNRERELMSITEQPERAQAARTRIAHLLGYQSWADYALATNMVQDPMRIEKFLGTTMNTVKPAADREAAAAQPNRRRRRDRNDPQNLRSYFPLDATIANAMNVMQELLAVTIAKDQRAGWSPDVTSYSVSDAASGRAFGELYIQLKTTDDLPAEFKITPLLPARIVSGKRRDAVAVMTGAVPGHLLPTETYALLHAIGRSMEVLLSQSAYESLSEARSDFVDAPAQTLGLFAWQPDVIKRLSPNMPDDAIAAMVTSRTSTNAFVLMQSLEDATHDLADGTATHYATIWSNAYADDLFTAFSSGTVLDPAIGMRFRQTILAPAGSLEPDVEVQNFLGRPMSPDAFYKEYTP